MPVSDLSFPSGHAFGAAAVYATVAFFCARFAQSHSGKVFYYLFASLLVAIVGLTRIYLGVHYPKAGAILLSLGFDVWRSHRSICAAHASLSTGCVYRDRRTRLP
ncbi:MAG: hypothetical protein RLZZ227_3155 [Pseudomonadota bacterium]